MRHPVRLAPALLLVAGVVTGCENPTPPGLTYSLNANIVENEESDLYNEDLAGDRTAQAQLAGALEMLFGSPTGPGYLLPEEWIDDEYNPSWGDAELTDDQWSELVEDNARALKWQLEGIAQGNFEAVVPPREAFDLQEAWYDYVADWQELRSEVELGEAEQSELDALASEITEEGTAMFEEWYPSLRESAEMYRQQCWHCHGADGGGNGSTADFLSPRPRDYRRGIFKFTALDNKARPRRDDLYRILEEGIYGSAMPSFKRFSKAQLNGLVDYVRLLAIRGETEILLSTEYDSEIGGFPIDVVMQTYLDVWAKWDVAWDEFISYDGEVPRIDEESIAHGRELFMDAKTANCFSCHGEDGRGGGVSAFEARALNDEIQAELDVIDAALVDAKKHAGGIAKDEKHKQQRHLALAKVERLEKRRFDLVNERVKDDWGNEIEPRDLTRGTFRFGRRPIDLFRRVYAGINGTPMPSHSSLKGPDGERLLTDEDLWDIVHYVRSLAVRELEHAPERGDEGAHGI